MPVENYMNIKTADKLVELRKSHGLSQEKLSELLGVSRQAISKWERGESSPDTDNLIALARIYGVSLDDIINDEKEIEVKEIELDQEPTEKKKKPSVYPKLGRSLFIFPFWLILIGLYVVANLSTHNWHPSWIAFLLLPIYYHFAGACFAKTKKGFLFALPVPEIIIMAYLILGFVYGLWAKGAIVFILIPIFYWAVAFYKKQK